VATIKVIEVIKRVEDVLQDSNVRWPRVELQNWLNESYLQIALLRPDASSKTGTLTCVAGSRQTITSGFSTALRLLDVVRNLASSSDKKVVRLIDRSVLDDQRPAWHTDTASVNIQNYTFDVRQPKEFFVFPPATTSAQLEVVYADLPGSHSLSASALDPTGSNTDVIKVDDTYLSVITDWILYRAFSKDAEFAANAARAGAHYQTFMSSIGNKTQSDVGSSPTEAV
jgi:hypothetical protein|tara:strand:+ start:3235 stop:3915 length:681 start_codon:yes stop_codon:yes gene_type:complete